MRPPRLSAGEHFEIFEINSFKKKKKKKKKGKLSVKKKKKKTCGEFSACVNDNLLKFVPRLCQCFLGGHLHACGAAMWS